MYLGEDDSPTGSQFDSTRQSRLHGKLFADVSKHMLQTSSG